MAQAASAGKRGQLRPERTAGVAALKRLFGELGERYLDRAGGYTRIFKLGHREGDRAELAIIELVDNPREKEALEAAKKRAKGGSAKKKKSSETKKTAGRVRASESEADNLEATTGETAADSSGEQETESKSS
jgi:large subunit ribosomal protein L17